MQLKSRWGIIILEKSCQRFLNNLFIGPKFFLMVHNLEYILMHKTPANIHSQAVKRWKKKEHTPRQFLLFNFKAVPPRGIMQEDMGLCSLHTNVTVIHYQAHNHKWPLHGAPLFAMPNTFCIWGSRNCGIILSNKLLKHHKGWNPKESEKRSRILWYPHQLPMENNFGSFLLLGTHWHLAKHDHIWGYTVHYIICIPIRKGVGA